MLFQTQIPLQKQLKNQIDYNSKILLLGSCFSENIGNKLSYFQLKTLVNPFGILFHPKAIASFIKNCVEQKKFTEKDVFLKNESWHCFNAHSSLSNPDKEILLKNLNENISKTNAYLKETTHLIITLGTSWVYKHNASNKVVANCHKVPQKEFTKEICSVDEISENLNTIVSSIKKINKNCTVIFTVSPVRHLKDGFIENMQSKSHLISGIHQFLTSEENKTISSYFPAYEIMMDELRDYRFYNQDMIHPNETAIRFIWEKFITVWISETTSQTMLKVDDIQKRLQHKPFNPDSEAHQKFLKNLAQKKETLLKEFPFMKF